MPDVDEETGPAAEPATPGPADEAASPERPELSAPLANYIDLVRHSAVRLAVANAPKIALRLMLAHVIAGASRWRIEPEAPERLADLHPGGFDEARRSASPPGSANAACISLP